MRRKSLIAIAITALAIWYLCVLVKGVGTLANQLERREGHILIAWGFGIAAAFSVAINWARVIRIPLGASIFRASLFFLGVTEMVVLALVQASAIKSFWTNLTLPLGPDSKPEAIGAAFLACALGPTVALGLNLLLPSGVAASRHFQSQWINGLEDLIYSAADRGQLVMLTLINRKVYIGHIKWAPPHPEARDAYVQIVPYFSGYRTPGSHELKLVTSYGDVYKNKTRSETERFRKVIPIAKILSAGEFDIDHYETFATAQRLKRTTPAERHNRWGIWEFLSALIRNRMRQRSR